MDIEKMREALNLVHNWIANTAWSIEDLDEASAIDVIVCEALSAVRTETALEQPNAAATNVNETVTDGA